MNKNNTLNRFGLVLLLLLFIFSLIVKEGFSAVVTEDEAIAVADMWYTSELSSG